MPWHGLTQNCSPNGQDTEGQQWRWRLDCAHPALSGRMGDSRHVCFDGASSIKSPSVHPLRVATETAWATRSSNSLCGGVARLRSPAHAATISCFIAADRAAQVLASVECSRSQPSSSTNSALEAVMFAVSKNGTGNV